MAKLQSEYFLKQNPKDKRNQELSEILQEIGFEFIGIQGQGGFGFVFKIKKIGYKNQNQMDQFYIVKKFFQDPQ